MEKIKYIKGNQEHAREIENYFVSMGAELARHYSYAMETFVYFVNPDTGCVDGYGVYSWEFKAFEETGVFEELKYPYDCTITDTEPNGRQAVAKPKLQVIQGVPFRGDEVIALLESLGGKRTTPISGSGSNGYYYINEFNRIDFKREDSVFFDKYELEVLTLPEGNKPKLQVIQGDPCRSAEVIERLVSMGGKNTIPLFGRSPQDYYYINNFGCIEGHVKNHKFFDDYELEIMTLPEKIERPKLQVIQGVPGRGDEVIALLESLGGVNRNNYIGNLKGLYYFIDPRNPDNAINYLGNVQMSLVFKDYDIDVITLPEKVEKPKMKVIKGDPDRGAEVIKALEAIGGCNSNGYEGRNDSCYYFIDASCDGKSIMYLLCGADFFKDYDLEILTLPDEVVKPKLKVIKGDPDRGAEVIKLLKGLGGINSYNAFGDDPDTYYYIDEDKRINTAWDIKYFKNYEIEILTLPKKFVPFVSKVLVRNNPGYLWMPAFFFSEESEGGARWYHIVGTFDTYRECIPYEGNEELVFTSNDVRSM